MPKLHRRRPKCHHKSRPESYAALLSRLTALEAALTKQATARGLAQAPPPLVRLIQDLLAETHALLPGRARKSALRRLRPDHSGVSHAELSIIAGQARALLAAFISMRGLDKPPAAPNPKAEAMRARLTKRISQMVEERVEKGLAETEAREAEEEKPLNRPGFAGPPSPTRVEGKTMSVPHSFPLP